MAAYRIHLLAEDDGVGGYRLRAFKAIAPSARTSGQYQIDAASFEELRLTAHDFGVTTAGAIKYSSVATNLLAELVVKGLALSIPSGKAVSIAAAVGTTASITGGTTKPITAKAALTCSECSGTGFYTSPISAKQSPCSRGCATPAVPAGAKT